MLGSEEKKKVVFILVIAIFLATLEVVGVVSIVPFLSILGDPEIINRNQYLNTAYLFLNDYGVKNKLTYVILLGVGSFFLITLTASYRAYAAYQLNDFVEMARHSLSSKLFSSIVQNDYEFFIDKNSSSLVKVILSEVDQFVLQVLRPTILMLSHSLLLVALLVLLVLFEPLLALALFGIFGSFYFLVYSIARSFLGESGRIRVLSNSLRFKIVSEAFAVVKDVKFFQCEERYVETFKEPSQKFSKAEARHKTLSQIPQYILEAIAFACILGIAAYLVFKEGLDSSALGKALPILGIYAFAGYRMQPSLRTVYQGVVALKYGSTLIDNLYASNTQYQAPLKKEKVKKQLSFNNQIELKEITYKYPEAERFALEQINLKINLGSSIAVVGSSGAGKTTLADIILGLLNPTSGQITIDGVKISKNQHEALGSFTGYVPQLVTLADSTVAENISFGRGNAAIDMAKVRAAAKLANIDRFINETLPQKYETMLGENGIKLSGGERQRLGIARALYTSPKLLVFDEATSALDTLTEREVVNAIETLTGDRTVIVIAHRLSTVKHCEQVILMEKGQIRAIGTYEELQIRDQVFEKMLSFQ